jgi:hypothetical protein
MSLAASGATTAKMTITSKPMMTATLRLVTGDNPRRISHSASQPPLMLANMSNANEM